VDADPGTCVTGDRRRSSLRRKRGRRGCEESDSSVMDYCRRICCSPTQPQAVIGQKALFLGIGAVMVKGSSWTKGPTPMQAAAFKTRFRKSAITSHASCRKTNGLSSRSPIPQSLLYLSFDGGFPCLERCLRCSETMSANFNTSAHSRLMS
jgi:hypothetical protein